MAYTVLARRYRSSTFDEVIGQEHVAQTLKRAIESGRIAHAFLFTGTRGVGKTSMARILAKALNCESSDKPTTQPCGKCNSCQAIARGDDIDVIEIDAASNTGVDNVRDIIDNARYRPARARFKVYIIDEVHMLSKAAFNALLKIMEEPPEHVKFILATTEAEKILPTILSRCQRYDFRNIPTREIVEHLRNIARNEKIDASDDALTLVAKAGAGSMRDSLSLLDRLLSAGEQSLTVEMIEQLLGLPRSLVIFELAQSIGEGNVAQTLERADAQLTAGLSPETLVGSLIDHLRNLLIIRACGMESRLVEVPGLPPADLKRQAEQFDTAVLTQDIVILEELRRQLRSGQASRALLDATLVRLAMAGQFASIDELLDRLTDNAHTSAVQKKKPEQDLAAGSPLLQPPSTSGEKGNASLSQLTVNLDDAEVGDDLPAVGKVWEGPRLSLGEAFKRSSAPPAPPPNHVEPVGAGDGTDLWDRLVAELHSKSPALPPLLEGARLVDVDLEQGTAILRYAHEDAPRSRLIDRNGKKEMVAEALSTVLGKPTRLRIEVEPAPDKSTKLSPDTFAPPRTKRPSFQDVARQGSNPTVQPASTTLTSEQKTQLAKDPLVRAVLEALGGDIVKVE